MNRRTEQVVSELQSIVNDLRDALSSAGASTVVEQYRAATRSIQELEAHQVPVPQQLKDVQAALAGKLEGTKEVRESLQFLLTAVRESFRELKKLAGHRANNGDPDKARIKRTRVRPIAVEPGQVAWTVPTSYRLFDEQEQLVRSWREVLLGVVERLLREPTGHWNTMLKLHSKRGRRYFSENRADLRDPVSLNNGFFVEGNLNAAGVLKVAHALLEACGYQVTDLSVKWEAKQSRENSV